MKNKSLPVFIDSQCDNCLAGTESVKKSLPVWRASARMAIVAAASLVAAGLMATGITGCADMPGIQSTAAMRDLPSLGLPAAAQASGEFVGLDDTWWRAFGDEQLDRLIAQALETSPSLKLAQARLSKAQAVTEVVQSSTQPQLNGQLDATRQLFTANGLVPPPLAGTVRETGTAQFSASWELDFFGKNRAALNAALGTVHAAEADAQAARVLLASNVARSYFQLARLNEQVIVARRTLAQRAETLELVKDRVSAGLDTRLELLQSQGGLPEARLQLEALQEQMALTRNALSALVGQSNIAQTLNAPVQSAIKNVAMTASIPADLLGRRADIAAARWRVEASSQDVSNAKTQFYPNINLVAFAGFSSIGLNRLFDAGSQQWGVGPALRLPIFDAGRLRANLRGKTADLDAAIESYNAAVVEAVRDVADQVTSMQAIGCQQTEQRAAQTAAEDAYDIAVQRYKAGLGNYLNVLTVETNVLIQRRGAVDLAARALDTQVALIRALGGAYASAGVAVSQAPESDSGFNAIKTIASKPINTSAVAR